MIAIAKFLSLPKQEKRFFYEALPLLIVAKFGVKVIPFRYIYRFLHDRWKDLPTASLDYAADIRLVKASLSRAERRLPWNTLCLPRSIAAFIMLRRRGIPTVMYVGVKYENCSLLAHAWVQIGREMVDGKPDSPGFTTLMTIGQPPQ